jgi:hypothetical protein
VPPLSLLSVRRRRTSSVGAARQPDGQPPGAIEGEYIYMMGLVKIRKEETS